MGPSHPHPSSRPPCSSHVQNPARILLWLEGGERGAARRLLDAERIVFRSDAGGRVPATGPDPGAIVMRAERWAMHRDGEAGAPQLLAFDIGGRGWRAAEGSSPALHWAPAQSRWSGVQGAWSADLELEMQAAEWRAR